METYIIELWILKFDIWRFVIERHAKIGPNIPNLHIYLYTAMSYDLKNLIGPFKVYTMDVNIKVHIDIYIYLKINLA